MHFLDFVYCTTPIPVTHEEGGACSMRGANLSYLCDLPLLSPLPFTTLGWHSLPPSAMSTTYSSYKFFFKYSIFTGAGEDSWESFGQEGDQTSQS